MKNKKHIMLDLETLGVTSSATVFQIGACAFSIETGEIHDTFEYIVDISSLPAGVLGVDGSTLKWWLETDAELLKKLLLSGIGSEHYMYASLATWLGKQGGPKDITIWGNGISFDVVKIKNKFDEHKIVVPIHYRNERDVRTILALAADKLGVDESIIYEIAKQEDEQLHHALDDVKRQIRLVHYCYQALCK